MSPSSISSTSRAISSSASSDNACDIARTAVTIQLQQCAIGHYLGYRPTACSLPSRWSHALFGTELPRHLLKMLNLERGPFLLQAGSMLLSTNTNPCTLPPRHAPPPSRDNICAHHALKRIKRPTFGSFTHGSLMGRHSLSSPLNALERAKRLER